MHGYPLSDEIANCEAVARYKRGVNGNKRARIVEDLGLNALILARAIAAERCVKEVMASAFILKYSLPTASSVRQALKQLEVREIVYRTDDGYSIYDRLMRYWLIRK